MLVPCQITQGGPGGGNLTGKRSVRRPRVSSSILELRPYRQFAVGDGKEIDIGKSSEHSLTVPCAVDNVSMDCRPPIRMRNAIASQPSFDMRPHRKPYCKAFRGTTPIPTGVEPRVYELEPENDCAPNTTYQWVVFVTG